VPVISTLGGPVAQNVTGESISTPSSRLSYALVCKKSSPVRVVSAPVASEHVSIDVRRVACFCTENLLSVSVHKVKCSDADHFGQKTPVQHQQCRMSGTRLHQRKQKSRQCSPPPVITASDTAQVSRFCCFTCGKEYVSLQALHLHHFRSHEIQSTAGIKSWTLLLLSTTQSVSVFHFTKCSKVCSSERDLQMHVSKAHAVE